MVMLKLTPEEKNAIITELAERMKDIVYMNAREQAEKVLNEILRGNPSPDDVIDIEYKIQLVFNDILQILGRIRRKKQEEEYEGETVQCKVCGHTYTIYPSIPASDDSCPKCGSSNYTFIKKGEQKG